LFFVIAGLLATLMRIQLAVPNNHFLPPDIFNQSFTMHGNDDGFPCWYANRFWIRQRTWFH
jgi:heme/copper-type cytochrome/quinol oxidase subunit 1